MASANLELEFIAGFEPSDVRGKASNPMYSGSTDNKNPYQTTKNEPRTHISSNFEASTFFKALSRNREITLKDEVYLKKLVGA